MCSLHFTLSGITLLALPTSNNFGQLTFTKIPGESAWESCLSPIGVGCFSGNCYSSKLNYFDSGLMIPRNLLPLAGSSCTYFLFVFSALYTKMHISRYIQPLDRFPRSEWKLRYLSAISMSIMNLLHWKTELGFFILRSVLMSFLRVIITVATWIVLSTRTSLLSACTRTITSPFLPNAYCPVFKLLASHSRSGRMPLNSPHRATNSHLSV